MDVLRAFFDEAALARFECPEDEVVLLAVEANGEVIAVCFQIEEDSGALIELSGQEAEANRDLAVAEIVNVLCHGIGKVCVGLHAVDELFVLGAVDRARFRGQAGRRLAFDPLPSIDLENVIVRDVPVAHDSQEV